ncbi:H-type small acid-soluble spore protein [Cytobacillus sp. S13-E01]|uniref:H-type small acid-soluble spore protein n=1 Tax=Cytobacillus sp. S13-E01 TaxID=3031326 RepID=UPI0023D8A0EC|nr:H-type small acid-soluble spore protein [Cytobacillus sp. S13-E01]MDF0729062.1 H-type small acid-soluble spore protein [Cytobacillus sp. S13-E01]
MDIRRVKQILTSPEDITVHYNGASVWIDSCDEQGNTATVHLRERHVDKNTVPVDQLQEL